MLSEARLAAASDLLNVAKALLVRVATQSRVIAGQTASFWRILPLRMPLKGTKLIDSVCENTRLTWVGLSGLDVVGG